MNLKTQFGKRPSLNKFFTMRGITAYNCYVLILVFSLIVSLSIKANNLSGSEEEIVSGRKIQFVQSIYPYRIYVLDRLISAIQVFTLRGKILGAIKDLEEPGALRNSAPFDMAIDTEDRIFVSTQDYHCISVIKDM